MTGSGRWALPAPRTGLMVLIGGMLAMSLLLWMLTVAEPLTSRTTPHLPWWVLAVMFGVAELVVLHLQVRHQAQTLSLSELPLVVALFFSSPTEMVVAVAVGTGFVFVVVRRQPFLKALFNVALAVLGAVIAIAGFSLGMGSSADLGPQAWVCAIVVIVLAGMVDSVMVLLVIALHDGQLRPREIAREALRAPLTAPLVGCVGLIAVTATHADPRVAALIVILFAGLLAAYRAHASLNKRHLSLTDLYEFGRSVTAVDRVEDVAHSVLRGARDLLRARAAELVMPAEREGEPDLRYRLDSSGATVATVIDLRQNAPWTSVLAGGESVVLPRGTSTAALRSLGYREALVVPIPEEKHVIGALLVADRGDDARAFGNDDLPLLETVANQASLALRNGRLVDQLRREAFHDALTGLGNRALFRQSVDAELAAIAAESSRGCAVMLLDLDGFKEVNDSLGHHAGDQLLVHVARQLTAASEGGMVARLGGDEFSVLVTGVADDRAARGHGERVLRQLCGPIVLDGVDVEVRASLGIALSGEDCRDASTLLRRADEAMYAAKVGGGGLRMHDATAGSRPRDTQLGFLAELRRGLSDGDVVVYAQPQAWAGSHEVFAVEALIRWRHPALGMLAPEEFLPLAERHGLTHDLTALVLETATKAAAGWRRQGLGLRISVNLSARSLADPRTRASVGAILERHGLPAAALTLEITEDAVMSDPDRAVEALRTLTELGVRVSIDDFGTGYSSLSYLSRLPVSEVKIDGSFVSSLGVEPAALVIVRSIIDLGRSLRLDVIAEGVEDAATWAQLHDLGAGAIQGYVLAHPMPIEEVAGWLRTYTGGPGRGGPPDVLPLPAQGDARLRLPELPTAAAHPH